MSHTSEVIIYDTRALESAFCAYLGTTKHCGAGAWRARDIVFAAAQHNPDGTDTLIVPFTEWVKAMNILRSLPYGGRWVNKASKECAMWLRKATEPNNVSADAEGTK